MNDIKVVAVCYVNIAVNKPCICTYFKMGVQLHLVARTTGNPSYEATRYIVIHITQTGYVPPQFPLYQVWPESAGKCFTISKCLKYLL